MFISKFYRLGAHAMKSPAVRAATYSPAMAHNQYLRTQMHVSFCSTAAELASKGEAEKQKLYRMWRPVEVTPKVSELRNIRDHKRRLLVNKYEWKRKLYKALCKDVDLPSDVREKHRYNLSKLPRSSSITRIRNRCVLTGRSRGNYKMFRMSRLVFRGLARTGDLPGVKKESW